MKTITDELRAKRAVSDIIFAYRVVYGQPGIPLSYRQLAAELRQAHLPGSKCICHQTLKNWEDRRHLPRPTLLLPLLDHGRGWQHHFARDLLAAMHPYHYRPASYIGQRAHQRSLAETGPHKRRYDPYYTDHP